MALETDPPRPLNGLRWMVFQLVERCNLRCSMCYEWGSEGTYHGLGELATLDYDVFERVARECLAERPYFEFFGGEPLLHPRIEDAIRLIREGGSTLAIPTNGVLIEEQAEMLVSARPTGLWISLDGPEDVNDAQRGRGVFRRVTRGLDRLIELRNRQDQTLPRVGVTFVVTPSNHTRIEEMFLDQLDLSRLDDVSIEFQNFATPEEVDAYAEVVRERFGVESTPCARGYAQDPAQFADMDVEAIADQITRIKERCRSLGVRFFSNPRTVDATNYRRYFDARWAEMADARSRCAFPWIYAEVSARGDVTTCHSFYDHAVGNVHEQSLGEIWRGPRMAALRQHLRKELFSICTACCRYYNNSISSVEDGGSRS